MKRSLQLFAAVIILFVSTDTQAQVKKNAKDGLVTKVTKFKPPKVKAYIGRNTDTTTVTLDEALQLINLPINVKDDKSTVYTVSSYGFMYKSSSLVENEENGKKEVKFTTVGDQFTVTPLPEVWKANIQRTLKKNNQLLFFDILVKDKQGRIFYAPNVLIKIS